MIYANREYVEILTASLSGATGIKTAAGERWAFDMTNKTLIYNPLDLVHRPFYQVRGLVLHEMGHLMYTQSVDSSALYQKYPRLNEAYNVCEDLRIEQKLFLQFGDFATESIKPSNADMLAETFAPAEIAKCDPLRQTLLSIAYLLESADNYFLTTSPLTNAMPILHPDALKVIEKIKREVSLGDWAYEITRLDSFGKIQAWVDKNLYPYIKELLEKNPEKSDGDQDGKGNGKDDKSKSQAAKEGNANGKKQAEARPVSDEGGGIRAGTGASRDDLTPVPEYNEASALMRPYSDTLSNRLADVLKEKKAVNYSGLHKRGRLLSRNVTKIITNEERVFSRRNNPDTPDYKIYVVLDRSSSMRGSLAASAYLAGVMVYNTARKLKMPVEVWAFNDAVEVIAKDDRKEEYFLRYNTSGGTDDSLMVKYLAAKVKKDPTTPLMFIIGDGEGVSLPQGDLAYLQKRGFIMGIGVGNGAGSVARAYPNGVCVENAADVSKTIIKTLREIIKR